MLALITTLIKTLIPQITDFLQAGLKLTLHPRKMYLQHYSKGVHFLGMVIQPNHITSGRRLKRDKSPAELLKSVQKRLWSETYEEVLPVLNNMHQLTNNAAAGKHWSIRRAMDH